MINRETLGSYATRMQMLDSTIIDDSNDVSHTWVGVKPEKNEKQIDRSFTVYEDMDNRRAGIINFLTKVGSIQNLQQNDSMPVLAPQRIHSAAMEIN